MGTLIDIVGRRFGFWIVQKRIDNSKNGHVQWQCLCECGKEKNVTSNSLRSGNSTSCGCNHTPDLINTTFGKLTVLELSESKHANKRNWRCECECGQFTIASTYELRNKIILSCGCDLITNLQKTINDTKATKIKAAKNIQQSLALIQQQALIISQLKKELEKSADLLNKIKSQINCD